MEFHLKGTILRSKGGICQTIKIAQINVWFNEFDSSDNSIRMEHGIHGNPWWTRQGILLAYAVSLTATDHHLTRDVVREASLSSMFRQLYLEAKEAYAKPSRFHT
uniref:Uncharacterized protein n=1 Tax=Oryza rufipogon TaxID=4529 RepID=A0A0E0P7K9_ORYRU